MDSLADRLTRVRERIARACARAGRDPTAILLVAVSKGFPAEAVRAAAVLGLTDFGENRVQEAERKIPEIVPRPRWHLVGHLQTNKAKRAVQLFDEIQSVDSVRLAEELDRRAEQERRVVPCLVEVNTSGEESKFGVEPAGAEALLERCRALASLRVHGLMTIGPLARGPEGARQAFRMLAGVRDAAVGRELLPRSTDLSMGMSDDFEIGIEEGATIVRVGTALFGPRPAGAPPVG
jgi:hypothetical protein